MQQLSLPVRRDALARATLFLELAENCSVADRNRCEAFLEAALVFGRTAIQRMQYQHHGHPGWKPWFSSLRGNVATEFFRHHRNRILHEGAPRVNQNIGGNPSSAAELYYFETPEVPATATVRRHLEALTTLVHDAELQFSQVRPPTA